MTPGFFRKHAGSKSEANRKGGQSGTEKEGEKENEIEIENECYPPTPLWTLAAKNRFAF